MLPSPLAPNCLSGRTAAICLGLFATFSLPVHPGEERDIAKQPAETPAPRSRESRREIPSMESRPKNANDFGKP